MVILITYVIYQGSPSHEQQMVTLAAAVFILPFFLFSATAGQLADKYDKAKLARIIKFFEIPIMALGAIGLYQYSTITLMVALFLMGTHSTFFGPIKYAILPDHLYEDELISGNALVEASTFLAILLGTLLGGILIVNSDNHVREYGLHIATITLIAVATTGWLASFLIPRAPAANPNLRINRNFIQETWAIMRTATHQHDVFLSIMGISWFWLVGGSFISQFPTFTKEVMHASAPTVSVFMSMFSVGIAIGSMLCNQLLKGEINAKFTPIALLTISLFLGDVHMATRGLNFAPDSPLQTIPQFLTHWTSWRVLIDFLMLSIAGGIYIVPLYAILQTRSDVNARARMIACNNILNALFMALASVIILVLLTINFSITQIFFVVAILNAFVAIYITRLVPHSIIQSMVKWLLVSIYRVKVTGLEHYKSVEGRMVIISNHTSFLDAMLISTFLPDKITFAINTHIAAQWWMRPMLALVDTFPLDPTNSMSTKSLIKTLKANKKVMIFPEGRITVTGSLMKVYEGPGLIADAADATMLPIRIEGAQYTPFSRLRGKVNIRLFPKIQMIILPPQKFDIPKDIKGRRRRELISEKLYDVMADMLFASSPMDQHIFESLILARKIHGRNQVVAEDISRNPTTLNQLITRSLILGRHIKYNSRQREVIGVMLPNMVNTLTVFFALQAYSRVPAMLNYSAGPNAVVTACTTAQIKTVLTSRQFIEKGQLDKVTDAIAEANIQLVYLEDTFNDLSLIAKITGFLTSLTPKRHFRHYNYDIRPSDPAVILFTSGSEGVPKGVVLSHKNLQANRFQLAARIDLSRQDVVLNALPMFHSFGLNSATLLPILSGLKVILYPSPKHYRIIPELSYEHNATVLFGTDTFLANYGKYCHPYDFYSIRYVIAGAEPLKEQTRKLWSEKLGIRILQGYGATEAAPTLATNTPMHNKLGTVGRFLPGISYRLEPVEGIDEGGRLFVKGPNIMMGYMLLKEPGQIFAPKDGWFDTGDIVNIDGEGFIRIIGRAKRFAKIGGEMVSLGAVEQAALAVWPNAEHAVVCTDDAKKGEQLVLVTTESSAERQALLAYLKQQQLTELMLPKQIIPIGEVPLLASGKIDYQAVKTMADRAVAEQN